MAEQHWLGQAYVNAHRMLAKAWADSMAPTPQPDAADLAEQAKLTERLLADLDAAAAAKARSAAEASAPPVRDLMAELEASLEAAKARRTEWQQQQHSDHLWDPACEHCAAEQEQAAAERAARLPAEAVAAVAAAVRNPGPRPGYHRQQVARLQAEWPTLWAAVELCLQAEVS